MLYSLGHALYPGVYCSYPSLLVDFNTVTFFIQGNKTWLIPCLAVWCPLWFECEYFHSIPSFLSELGKFLLFRYFIFVLRNCLVEIWRNFFLVREPEMNVGIENHTCLPSTLTAKKITKSKLRIFILDIHPVWVNVLFVGSYKYPICIYNKP